MKRIRYGHLFFISFAILIISHGISSLSAAKPLVLEEIIVKGERIKPAEESLDIKEIRETTASDIGEALKVVEGINSVRKGAIANDIVLRGFMRDNLNVLVDGMKIYGACPNRMDPSSGHIDFAEIKKVSVHKGPFDVRHPGSLGGTIEISTIEPKKGFGGEINTFIGSYKNINTSIYTWYGKEKSDILLGYSYKYSLPYKDGDGDRITEQYPSSSVNRYKDGEENDRAYSINTFWAKYALNLSDYHRVEVNYARQEGDDILYPYLLMDAIYNDTDRINVTYEGSNICRFIEKIIAQFYFNRVKHDMTDEKRVSSLSWPAKYMMKTYAETKTYGGKVESDIPAGIGSLSLGIDYYYRNWNAKNWLPTGVQKMMPDVDLSNVGAFFEYSRPFLENIMVTLGGRCDRARSEAHDDRTDLYYQYHGTYDDRASDSFYSGNIQITYFPAEPIEFFAGFGQSTRPPDPEERYIALEKPMSKPNWVGNPKLDPVKNREFDIGIKYTGDQVYGKATFFYADIKDFITVYNTIGPVKNAKSFKNVDATLYGGEVSFNAFLPFDLTFRSGLSYTWARDDTSDEPLPEIPPLKGRIALRYEPEKYFIEVESIFADDQHRVNSDLNEEKTQGWAIVNFKAGMNYDKFSLFAGVNNVFDRQYFEHLSYQRDPFGTGIKVPEIGRYFYLNITYSW